MFGFWDTFADVADVYTAITRNTPVRFRVSYHVTGWLPDAASDPLATLAATVTSQYNDYVAKCADQNVRVTSTPADVFASVTASQFGWQFSGNAVSYTLAADETLATLEVPDTTLCAGVIQEVVWDQLHPPQNTPFLAAPGGGPWTDKVEIALGNTTVQAVSALVKSHLSAPGGTEVLASYETLLDALQLGLLRDIEGQGNALATLEQALHANAFSQLDGGHQWTIQTKAAPGSQASVEVTLPLTLAEQLTVLNTAQLGYDQARRRVEVARQQLFMDWVIYVKQLCQKPAGSYVVPTNTLSAFLATASSAGELNAVVSAGDAAGLLHYQTDPGTGRITGVSTADAPATLAGQVVSAYATVAAALAALPDDWELDAIPAAPFWMPTDPVLVMEGDRLEPARRNGPAHRDRGAHRRRADRRLADRERLRYPGGGRDRGGRAARAAGEAAVRRGRRRGDGGGGAARPAVRGGDRGGGPRRGPRGDRRRPGRPQPARPAGGRRPVRRRARGRLRAGAQPAAGGPGAGAADRDVHQRGRHGTGTGRGGLDRAGRAA